VGAQARPAADGHELAPCRGEPEAGVEEGDAQPDAEREQDGLPGAVGQPDVRDERGAEHADRRQGAPLRGRGGIGDGRGRAGGRGREEGTGRGGGRHDDYLGDAGALAAVVRDDRPPNAACSGRRDADA
jgi:hypothetical protein